MKKVEENKVWMVHPDKRIVTVGDSSEGTALRINFPKGDPSCINDFSRRIDCYLSRAFTRSGYGIVRSDWSVPQAEASMLFFMAAFHSTAHKLPDDLSFELFEFGERLLTNSGKYSYNEDHFRSFVESTRAHNTVTIDDQSHSLMPHAAYGSGLINVEKRGNFFHLNGEVTHRAIGTRHHRELLFAPRQWLLVIDHLDANTVRSFTQWFHFGPQIEVNSTGDAAIYEAKLANGRTIRIEQVQPGCSSELVKGRTTPSIQGWVTVSYGKMTPRYSLGFSCSGREKKMVTLFVLDPENREDALSVLTNTSQNHGASKILQ
jgi:hypothetical protein